MPAPARAEHKPDGDPCTHCGLPANRHRFGRARTASKDTRVYHNPQGDPCSKCGHPADRHRVEHQPTGDPCHCGLPFDAHTWRKKVKPSDFYIGIDGEGQGREDHRYVMLAWSDETGQRRDVIEAPEGGRLTTEQCLDFILATPERGRLFAFSFGYDLAKILTDVDDKLLYLLARPDLRPRTDGKPAWLGPMPVKWRGYRLNAVGSKFTVEKSVRIGGRLIRTQRTIWDSFKFFQAKFTTALEDWKVASVEKLTRMREMKDQRHLFDKLSRTEILDYCFEECAYMATLAHKLTDAHNETGLPPLTQYHGAGSIAGTVLKKFGIDKMKRSGPAEMDLAVSSSFFGGRFENRWIGRLHGPIYGFDLSSAYPYQLTFLPCLDCGRWELTTNRADLDAPDVQTACVRYTFAGPTPEMKWGPFPFRSPEGTICFPLRSRGGWVWLPEFLAGEKHWSHVRFAEAWIYRNTCSHRPFEEIPALYLNRLQLGKEGPGIVIKLGCNACYGRLAQSVGVNPPFQSWIWAGLITSGTRAQILEAIALHKDQANLLMIATDGIYSWEDLKLPPPRYTGTGPEVTQHLKNSKGDPLRDDKGRVINKPLGGWERSIVERDMFAAKPGIYYPIDPSEADIKKIRARGVGRRTLLEKSQLVVDAFERGEKLIKLDEVSRFHGIKSSVTRQARTDLDHPPDKMNADDWTYSRALMLNEDGSPWRDEAGNTRERYGQWSSLPIEMTFTARPKRKSINPDNSLEPWHFFDAMSAPYDKLALSRDALALKAQYEVLMEQPDGDDYTDFETEEWTG